MIKALFYFGLIGLITLACGILLLAVPAHAAVTLQSYSDQARTQVCDSFTVYQAPVYMQAIGLNKNKSYTCQYFDGGGTQIQSETSSSNGSGVWLGMVLPSEFPNSTAGTWEARLYDWTGKLVGTDTFSVSSGAIPEVSDILTGIGLAGVCGVIYWRVRE